AVYPKSCREPPVFRKGLVQRQLRINSVWRRQVLIPYLTRVAHAGGGSNDASGEWVRVCGIGDHGIELPCRAVSPDQLLIVQQRKTDRGMAQSGAEADNAFFLYLNLELRSRGHIVVVLEVRLNRILGAYRVAHCRLDPIGRLQSDVGVRLLKLRHRVAGCL